MVRADVCSLLEPVSRRLVKNLTLVGHRGQHVIEGALTVGRDHDAPAVRQVIGISHLAALEIRKRGVFSVGQAGIENIRHSVHCRKGRSPWTISRHNSRSWLRS